MKRILIIFIFLFPTLTPAQKLPLHLLKTPPGFSIDIFAYPVPNARTMTIGKNGTVFVGTNSDKVYAIAPDSKNASGHRVLTIASNLSYPNGVAFHDGSLYVAEIHRILRFDNIESHLMDPQFEIITDALPKKEAHGLRVINFGPDGKLYVAIGMPCDVCVMQDKRLGTISRMNADGSNFEIFAKGIRNSVGFDWDPTSKKLWFTDNGRDHLGDNQPPDKLNYAPVSGLDFGFPYFNDKDSPDPDYGKLAANKTFTPPTYRLPAHVAALGMKFYTHTKFPLEYHKQIFIAEHGSWNRSNKVGYQVITAKINNDRVVSSKPFITGWLQREKYWGRPVDLLVMPDGSLLISDDTAGVIYRVRYNQPKNST